MKLCQFENIAKEKQDAQNTKMQKLRGDSVSISPVRKQNANRNKFILTLHMY